MRGLLKEAQELAKELNKLNDFMRSENFINIKREEKDLLYEQSRAMNLYLQILSKRLELANIKFYHKNKVEKEIGIKKIEDFLKESGFDLVKKHTNSNGEKTYFYEKDLTPLILVKNKNGKVISFNYMMLDEISPFDLVGSLDDNQLIAIIKYFI